MTPQSPLSIAVAVSGGADSLHTLLELHEAGLPVMAVHGLFGQRVLHDFLVAKGRKSGTWPDAGHERIVSSLQEITASRGIPFHVLDCAEEFLAQVVQPFVEQYAAGQTPNPCALCNTRIKFGLLYEKSLALGASHLATGHYARLAYAPSYAELQRFYSPPPALGDTGPALIQGADPLKDQTYFLALVQKEHLGQCIFPLGERRKSDVLASLARQGITLPQAKESQDVCFIPANNRGGGDSYREFLPFMADRLHIPLPGPGPVCLQDGHRLGTHKGLWQYTEGQRKGLGIGWKEPLHVLGKEVQTNTLRLGPQVAMGTRGLVAGLANILLDPALWGDTVFVKTRYRETPKRATVQVVEAKNALEITFMEKETAVAPGQLAAVYIPVDESATADEADCMRLVAGGIIQNVRE